MSKPHVSILIKNDMSLLLENKYVVATNHSTSCCQVIAPVDDHARVIDRIESLRSLGTHFSDKVPFVFRGRNSVAGYNSAEVVGVGSEPDRVDLDVARRKSARCLKVGCRV